MGPCSDKMIAAKNHAELFQSCQTYLGSITEELDAATEGSEVDVRQTLPLLDYAGRYTLYHFEVACIAGVLRSSSLHEFPIQQYVFLTFLDSEIGSGMYQQLSEPHRLFTSLLYVSIRKGYAQLAEALLAETAVHSSCVNNRGCTSATASTSGFDAAKIDLNIHLVDHWSTLLENATEWCPCLVRPLLDHGADVNVDEGAPLCMAAELCTDRPGMEHVVLLLLSRGAHAQVYQTSRGTTPLALAVKNGSYAIVTLLLEHGADANGAIGTPAVSPLLASLGHNLLTWEIPDEAYELTLDPLDEKIVHALLEHGADVYLKAGPKQISPLQYATEQVTEMKGSRDILRLLTSYGQRYVNEAEASLSPTD
jgi:hypothetical protein